MINPDLLSFRNGNIGCLVSDGWKERFHWAETMLPLGGKSASIGRKDFGRQASGFNVYGRWKFGVLKDKSYLCKIKTEAIHSEDKNKGKQ